MVARADVERCRYGNSSCHIVGLTATYHGHIPEDQDPVIHLDIVFLGARHPLVQKALLTDWRGEIQPPL